MFWRDFPTKKAVEETIRAIVTPKPFKVPFESSLLSDLVAERHYFCSLRNLRPCRFRKLPGYGAYTLEGDFADVGWHGVSWTKCLVQPLTEWDRIVRAMRDRSEPAKRRYKSLHPVCEGCGTMPTAEVHHQNPPFKIISDMVRTKVSDADVHEVLKDWNWFARDNFILPEGHPITVAFDEIHRAAELQALCRVCHNKTKRRKRLVTK